ncbi:hypothetical protein ACKKBG_A31670 [Auxenochlorella protothecoides x Auxenochlorella symbiontica]|uniref:Uncharacterized protein n=1 Tax=Auxenochlorella protothecoides TaxID=3075 RepID=A0A087SK73_AUXPR|nr:hypothetical protein F751_6278 [Auxenochlorella protothecoides]KFM26127.1 hypothetical protein F751_6278 [Auxenochlorella protothecoides]RMZ53382.1 hypothetical protein APUTEX25_004870 [Auxenochlorella protothecoides]|eukprot:RMZ53382.1 hypothetical protein APUTEX25_004870 [Auxenochlorella protothecoides]
MPSATSTKVTTGGSNQSPGPKSRPLKDTGDEGGAAWATGDFGNSLATPQKSEAKESKRSAPDSTSKEPVEENEDMPKAQEAGEAKAPRIKGLETFDGKLVPFAAGFENMVRTAPVYRSHRLHAINPTAAVSDDVSYLYTLDSGRVTPASAAADPNYDAEFIRNTTAASKGGLFQSLLQPIK